MCRTLSSFISCIIVVIYKRVMKPLSFTAFRDSDEEIASLKKRLKDLEKKLEKETEKYKRMENMVSCC